MEQTPGRQQYEPKEKVPVFRDIWQFIIKLILALLVIAWFVREYLQDKELNPIKLIILLIVLCVIIWLILKQRHFVCLKCKLTDPGGCVKGDPGIITGKLLEPVLGDAYGWGFSHYFLELRSPNGTLLSNVIIYPDSGGNPDTSFNSRELYCHQWYPGVDRFGKSSHGCRDSASDFHHLRNYAAGI